MNKLFVNSGWGINKSILFYSLLICRRVPRGTCTSLSTRSGWSRWGPASRQSSHSPGSQSTRPVVQVISNIKFGPYRVYNRLENSDKVENSYYRLQNKNLDGIRYKAINSKYDYELAHFLTLTYLQLSARSLLNFLANVNDCYRYFL